MNLIYRFDKGLRKHVEINSAGQYVVYDERYVLSVLTSLSGILSNDNGDYRSMNPHRYNLNVTKYGSGTVITVTNGYTSTTSGSGVGSEAYPGYSNQASSVYNLAINRLYESLRGNVDLSIDFLQYKKTVSMVNSAQKCLRRLERLFALCAYAKRSPLKAASEAWLTWNYGIAPSIATLVDLYKQTVKSKDGTVRVKGSATLRSENLIVYYPDKPRSTKVDYFTDSCRIVAHFALTDDTIERLSRISSLNPLSIFYENTPFSFVLDWFYDFSGYLRSYETALIHRSNFYKGYYTQVAEVLSIANEEGSWVQFPTASTIDTRGYTRLLSFKREILGTAPVPHLPHWNPSIGWRRIASSVALLRSSAIYYDASGASKRLMRDIKRYRRTYTE